MKNDNLENIINLFENYFITLDKLAKEKNNLSYNNQSIVIKLQKTQTNKVVFTDFYNSILDDFPVNKLNTYGLTISDVFGESVYNNVLEYIETAFNGQIVEFNAQINNINLFVTLVPVFYNNELIEVIGTCFNNPANEDETESIIRNVKQIFSSLKQALAITNEAQFFSKLNSNKKDYLNRLLFTDQNLLNKVLSFAKIGLWRVEINQMDITVSEQVYEILGLNKDVKGNELNKWLELINNEDISRVNNDYEMFIQNKLKIFESTFRVKKQPNDWIWVKCIGQSYYTDPKNNLPTTIVGLVIDIHSEKSNDLEKDRLISELKKSNFAAEETATEIIELYQEVVNSEKFFIDMNLKKDELFSILSVELKSSILGFLSLSNLIFQEYHNFSKEEIRDALKEIHISSKNLFDFLENILLWTQINNKNIEYNPNFFYLKDIINESLLLFSNIIKEKHLTIENNIDEKIVVFVDYNMINSLFRNLISNSIKFSKQKSKIIINSKPIELNTSFVEISINDNGIGIDDKLKKYIFKFNKKVIRRGSNNEIGSGLGLILCKEFINYHKGKIWFESKRSAGTTFYFTLPLAKL